MRRLPTALAAAAVVCLSAAPVPAQTYHVRAEQARRPLEIVVYPGDRLSLKAGGCLSVAGQPARPLLQEDPNLEQGLIFVPGVTMRFVPIAELVGRSLFVPRELDSSETRIWLDWGRSFRNPLQSGLRSAPRAPRPCETPNQPAELEVRIERDSTPGQAPTGTLNLELTAYDSNLLPLNPKWAGGVRPDVCAACDGFKVQQRGREVPWIPALESPHCTSQHPYVDAGGCRPHRGECRGPGPRLRGHVNWGPATFTGLLSTTRGGPVHISLDGDVNFYLEPDGGAGLLAQKVKSRFEGLIGVEFASAETLRWFRTPWWRLFPFRHSSYKPVGSLWTEWARQPGVQGKHPSLKRRPATVIGIFGIDTAHGTHPEIHPVHAIAIQTRTHPDHDVYDVFARNWGTGGDCAGRLDARIATHRIALRLPGAAGRTYEAADGTFWDHGLVFSNWKVHMGGSAPELVIELPPDRPCSVIEGQLFLRRSPGPGADDHLTEAPAPVGEPVRLDLMPGGPQLCVQQPWFLPVR